MIDARKCALIDWLPADAFSEERDASLYRLIRDMHSNGDPVDVITVAERSPEGWLDHEILQLTGDTPSASNVVAYAEILLQAWKRRSVARVASALASDMRGDVDLDAASMAAVSKINEITASTQRSGPMLAKTALKQWFAEFQQRAQSGDVMTGKIGGLKVVTENAWFAARPSGTEDVYKIYGESFNGPEHLAQVQEEAKAVVSAALNG